MEEKELGEKPRREHFEERLWRRKVLEGVNLGGDNFGGEDLGGGKPWRRKALEGETLEGIFCGLSPPKFVRTGHQISSQSGINFESQIQSDLMAVLPPSPLN